MACPPNQGPQLSREQVEAAAAAAGFKGEEIRLAAAVAWAESGLCLHAVGDGGKSHGLWQIHSPSWPQHVAASKSDDPIVQARAALAIRNSGRGWNHWTVYREKKTQGYFRGGLQKDPVTGEWGIPAGTGPGPIPGTETISAVGDMIRAIASGELLKRGLQIAVGLLIIVMAGNALIEDLSGANPLKKAAKAGAKMGTTVPAGKALKGASKVAKAVT